MWGSKSDCVLEKVQQTMQSRDAGYYDGKRRGKGQQQPVGGVRGSKGKSRIRYSFFFGVTGASAPVGRLPSSDQGLSVV